MKKLITALLASTLLAGCVHGTWFEPDEIAQDMKPGVTTYTDAVVMLGKPWKTERHGDGSKTITWDGMKTGPFYYGGTRRLVVVFGSDGKMEKIEQMTAN